MIGLTNAFYTMYTLAPIASHFAECLPHALIAELFRYCFSNPLERVISRSMRRCDSWMIAASAPTSNAEELQMEVLQLSEVNDVTAV